MVDHSVVGLFHILFPGHSMVHHSVVGFLLNLLVGHSVVDYSVEDLLFLCKLSEYLFLGIDY